jgi:hypothetical protein
MGAGKFSVGGATRRIQTLPRYCAAVNAFHFIVAVNHVAPSPLKHWQCPKLDGRGSANKTIHQAPMIHDQCRDVIRRMSTPPGVVRRL